MKSSSERSAGRFDRNLEKAVIQHDRRLSEGKLSLPSEIGKLVIVVSGAVDNNRSALSPDQQRNAFNNEADELASNRKNLHADVIVKRKATELELGFDLSDKEVSDIILIGHGNIGDFWLANGGHFGWRQVANYARNLKQGKIEQRICGNFPRKDSVPLATFGVSDQRRLIAPLGHVIDDEFPNESLFEPVYKNEVNTKHDIERLIADHYQPED